MLKLVIQDAKLWSKITDAITEIVDEGVFRATEDGLVLRSMDVSRVAMVDLKLPRAFFSEYECTGTHDIGFRFSEIKKLLKRSAKKGVSLGIEAPDEGGKVIFTFIGNGRSKIEFPLLDLLFEELPTPRVELEAKFKAVTQHLITAIKQISLFADQARFEAYNDRIIIKYETEYSRGEITYTRDELIDLEVEEEGVAASYSIEFLESMLKHKDLSEVVNFEFGSRKPAKITYLLINGGELTYWLAPRTE